jgi:hypothetical protein
MSRSHRLSGVVLALMITAACGSGVDGVTEPTPPLPPPTPNVGDISVHVSTVGPAPDPDGYTLLLDGATTGTISPQGTLVLSAVPSGHHTVALTGIAPGCDSHASGPKDVELAGGATTAVSFTVPCTGLATVRVVTHTSGAPPDSDGYVVTLGSLAGQAIGIEDTIEIVDVPAIPQQVVLGGVAANCYLAMPERRIGLFPGQTTDVTFDVSCLGPGRGSIVVTVSTTSILAPAEMTFAVELDGAHRLPVPSTGSVTYSDVEAGEHSIKLVLPGFCGVGLFGSPGTNPTHIGLRPGEHRTVGFHVLCIG